MPFLFCIIYETALGLAVKNESIEIIKLLLTNNNINVNCQSIFLKKKFFKVLNQQIQCNSSIRFLIQFQYLLYLTKFKFKIFEFKRI